MSQLAILDGRTSRGVVLPVLAPAAHDVVALVDLRQQPRDVVRVVLQVAVHGDDDVAAAVVDPGLDCRRLAEVAAKRDHAHAAIADGEAGRAARLLPSRLPSSMYTTSKEKSSASRTPMSSSCRGAMLSASLYTSTMTDSRGAIVAAVAYPRGHPAILGLVSSLPDDLRSCTGRAGPSVRRAASRRGGCSRPFRCWPPRSLCMDASRRAAASLRDDGLGLGLRLRPAGDLEHLGRAGLLLELRAGELPRHPLRARSSWRSPQSKNCGRTPQCCSSSPPPAWRPPRRRPISSSAPSCPPTAPSHPGSR